MNNPIRVTFDSNVIEDILGVKRNQHLGSEARRHNQIIAQLIKKQVIMPCVSIEYFVLEHFSKLTRSAELMRPPDIAKITLAETIQDNGCLQAKISFKASRYVNVQGIAFKTLQALRNVGGKVISCMRNGLPACRNINIDLDLLNVKDYGFTLEYRDRLFYEVTEAIEKIGCGEPYIRSRIGSCKVNGIFYDIENANISSKEKAKYLGELADCDLIASHIAYRNDFLCTLDRGGGFGDHAIFKQKNYMKLTDFFCLKVVTPTILVERLKVEGYLDNDLS